MCKSHSLYLANCLRASPLLYWSDRQAAGFQLVEICDLAAILFDFLCPSSQLSSSSRSFFTVTTSCPSVEESLLCLSYRKLVEFNLVIN